MSRDLEIKTEFLGHIVNTRITKKLPLDREKAESIIYIVLENHARYLVEHLTYLGMEKMLELHKKDK